MLANLDRTNTKESVATKEESAIAFAVESASDIVSVVSFLQDTIAIAAIPAIKNTFFIIIILNLFFKFDCVLTFEQDKDRVERKFVYEK